jgi:hypothetical protein
MQILFKVLAILVLAAIQGPSPNGYEAAAPLRRALFAIAGHHPLIRLAVAALAPHASELARTMSERLQNPNQYRLMIEMDVDEVPPGHTHADYSVVIHLNTGYLALTIRDPVPPFRICLDAGGPVPSSEESSAAGRTSAEGERREAAER